MSPFLFKYKFCSIEFTLLFLHSNSKTSQQNNVYRHFNCDSQRFRFLYGIILHNCCFLSCQVSLLKGENLLIQTHTNQWLWSRGFQWVGRAGCNFRTTLGSICCVAGPPRPDPLDAADSSRHPSSLGYQSTEHQ